MSDLVVDWEPLPEDAVVNRVLHALRCWQSQIHVHERVEHELSRHVQKKLLAWPLDMSVVLILVFCVV